MQKDVIKHNSIKIFIPHNLDYAFLDVEKNLKYAEELRNLYSNKKLNFSTIAIHHKKLRNPSEKELQKWIDKTL
ncbi:glutaredoxin family protein [uncultured Polaribacter sp.]|uniref:glutaredoxin family protein n=1 Tax=uncultured Polaribacter sp. TaxID=174711 RepID=UPI00263265AF|nr:glutaredoxin family protein [uncultured Polaribacter sp.]